MKIDLMAHFDSKFEQITSKLTSIETSISTLGDRADQLEQRVGANEDNITDISNKVKWLEKHNAYLLAKVDDLENRTRSCNLRFLGVQESSDSESQNMISFMSQLIPQLLGPDNFPSPPTIQRAYRTPTVRRDDNPKPRTILVKLLHFEDKVKILRLVRERKQLHYNGNQILIFPDYSAELLKRRISFNPVKKKLRELNLKFSLRYPSRLFVWIEGKEHQFLDHKAAEAVFSLPSSPMSTNSSPT